MGIALEKMQLGLLDTRTRSSWRCRAARATAPRRRSRISAWSPSRAAGSCMSAATAASRSRGTELLCKVDDRGRGAGTICAPSCSSIARRRAISSAPHRGSSASGSITSKQRIVEDAERRRALLRPLPASRSASARPIPGPSARAGTATAHEFRAARDIAVECRR